MRDDGALLLTLLLVAIWYRYQVMQWESERAALRAKLRHVRGIRQGRARSMRLLGGRRANGRAIPAAAGTPCYHEQNQQNQQCRLPDEIGPTEP